MKASGSRIARASFGLWPFWAFLLLISGALATLTAWPRFYPACTSELVQMTAALQRSTEELLRVTDAEPRALCSAYRKHVDALTAASPIFLACGPSQMTRRGAWPTVDAELAFYRKLVAEKCL
jgi:hypothetical protein